MDGHQEAALPGYPKVLVQLHYEKQNSKSQKESTVCVTFNDFYSKKL